MNLFEEHKAERRARILAAARELIAERGYDGITMRDLARASRVSVPTLYDLFGGKQALLLGELEHTFAAVVAAIGNARDGQRAGDVEPWVDPDVLSRSPARCRAPTGATTLSKVGRPKTRTRKGGSRCAP